MEPGVLKGSVTTVLDCTSGKRPEPQVYALLEDEGSKNEKGLRKGAQFSKYSGTHVDA